MKSAHAVTLLDFGVARTAHGRAGRGALTTVGRAIGDPHDHGRRYVSFHLTKFFLPLFIIVAIALAPLWIDPEDLSSRASIGVTCLLAAIAFQFAEAGSLPEVAYLTLADRVYVTCYVTLATALLASVYANVQARAGRKERAVRIDRRARLLLPAAMLLALALGVVRSIVLVQHG